MQLDRRDDIKGFECPACQAHVIRAGQIEDFLLIRGGRHTFTELLQLARAAPPSNRELACPDCRSPSYRTLRSGLVETDTCASCGGMFFDAGEVSTYIRQVRLRKEGGDAVRTAVDTVDATTGLAEFIINIFN
jgi:hypothetical protein